MSQSAFNSDRYKWRHVIGEPDLSYKVEHDYTILGYDLAAGTLDMLVRWQPDGGHCPIHRHTSITTVFVIDGEQHLWDLYPDGTRAAEPKVRRVGDYGLTVGDAPPHLECGGEEGGIAFFSSHSSDGLLYEILDEDLKLVMDVTMEVLIADWNENT